MASAVKSSCSDVIRHSSQVPGAQVTEGWSAVKTEVSRPTMVSSQEPSGGPVRSGTSPVATHSPGAWGQRPWISSSLLSSAGEGMSSSLKPISVNPPDASPSETRVQATRSSCT